MTPTPSLAPSAPRPAPAPGAVRRRMPGPAGVRLLGTGSYLPKVVITNADLEKVMDTSDEWIVQRTGIRQRYSARRENGESTYTMGVEALRRALADAKVDPLELDLVICATMTPEMTCPASSCRIVDAVGATRAGAWDLSAACSGFVYGMNAAHDLIMGGGYKTVAVIGADTLSKFMDYCDAGRGTAVIFGDGAGAAIFRACDDPSKGILAQSMHADGGGWKHIYIPEHPTDFPEGHDTTHKLEKLFMAGSAVFKFAVGTFPEVIQQTLDAAGLRASDIDMFVCHQSNKRILDAARERFGLPEDKLYINIDRVGNTVGASVPLCLDELRKAGRIKDGMKVLFVAFGGGLTWGSSLWQL